MALFTLQERVLLMTYLANPIVVEDMNQVLLFHARYGFRPQHQSFLSKRTKLNYMSKERVKNQNDIAKVEMRRIENLIDGGKTEAKIGERGSGSWKKAIQESAKERSGRGAVQRSESELLKRNEK